MELHNLEKILTSWNEWKFILKNDNDAEDTCLANFKMNEFDE